MDENTEELCNHMQDNFDKQLDKQNELESKFRKVRLKRRYTKYSVHILRLASVGTWIDVDSKRRKKFKKASRLKGNSDVNNIEES